MELYYDIAAVQDVVGENTPLVITIDRMTAAILSMSEKLSRKLDVTDFRQGDVTLKVSPPPLYLISFSFTSIQPEVDCSTAALSSQA